ncbi:MAG: hypothetical protein ABIW84_04620, partial [Ilumatobacteraceae bacterium]
MSTGFENEDVESDIEPIAALDPAAEAAVGSTGSAGSAGSSDGCGLIDRETFRGLSGRCRDRAYLAIERQVRVLTALQASLVAEVNGSCSFLDDHHHSATAWVQAVTNCSKAAAGQMTRMAAMFGDLSVLAAAATAGEVGPDQIRLLARLHANDRCRPQLPGSEDLLVGYARTLTLHDFTQVCRRWEAHADPDGAHGDHAASRANRHVRSSGHGAGHLFHAEGDALTGDIINEILNAHAQVEFETDLAERTQFHGGEANRYPLARTARQRRYDALIAIFLKAAGTSETTDRKPLVNIICTETALIDAIRNHNANDQRSHTQDPEDRSACADEPGWAGAPGQPPRQRPIDYSET